MLVNNHNAGEIFLRWFHPRGRSWVLVRSSPTCRINSSHSSPHSATCLHPGIPGETFPFKIGSGVRGWFAYYITIRCSSSLPMPGSVWFPCLFNLTVSVCCETSTQNSLLMGAKVTDCLGWGTKCHLGHSVFALGSYCVAGSCIFPGVGLFRRLPVDSRRWFKQGRMLTSSDQWVSYNSVLLSLTQMDRE